MVVYVLLISDGKKRTRQTVKVSSWNELVANLAENDIRGVTEIYLGREVAEAKNRATDYRRYLRGFKP